MRSWLSSDTTDTFFTEADGRDHRSAERVSCLTCSRGFNICRAIVQRYPSSCVAMYTGNPSVPAPTWRRNPVVWLKWCIAHLTGARLPSLSFGYVPSDFDRPLMHGSSPPLSNLVSPKTLAFALADSPTGLLAFMLGIIRPHRRSKPLLSASASSASCASGALNTLMWHSWKPRDVLTWTMMYWLSGPEAPLRWLRCANWETRPDSTCWQTFSEVPLGISHFRLSRFDKDAKCPPMWTSAYHNLSWLRRHDLDRSIRWPAWEASDELVADLRDFVRDVGRTGRALS